MTTDAPVSPPERLADAEGELAALRRILRWNVEHRDGEVLVCRNNHDKGDDCDWERFVPEEKLSAAKEDLTRARNAARYWEWIHGEKDKRLAAALARAERAEKALADSDTVRVPRLFDADAEAAAWQIWTNGGRHHESFVRCINAYVSSAALAHPATAEET